MASMNQQELPEDTTIRGDVFMIDRISKDSNGVENIEFKKVYMVMNKNKVQIGENASIET